MAGFPEDLVYPVRTKRLVQMKERRLLAEPPLLYKVSGRNDG
jgi:hypothetical protein